MATNNMLGVGLSGETGTGAFVGANTPTLITPVLGSATGTSINFGGSALSTYVESGTWTPTFTLSSVGDLSVAYSQQVGYYSRIGNMIILNFRLAFTPTYTTASGTASIRGVPFNSKTTSGVEWTSGAIDKSAFSFSAGKTEAYLVASGTQIFISFGASAASSTVASATQFPTATAQYIYGTINYLV